MAGDFSQMRLDEGEFILYKIKTEKKLHWSPQIQQLGLEESSLDTVDLPERLYDQQELRAWLEEKAKLPKKKRKKET